MLFPKRGIAQDLATAQQQWQERQLAAARQSIDAYLEGDGESDANGWLLKMKIYAAISTEAQWKLLVPDGKMDAFVALKKAVQHNKLLAAQQMEADSFAILRSIYRNYSDEGVASFNAASEKKSTTGYVQALVYFKNALSIEQFIKEQRWKVNLQPQRQVLQYNAAQAAINAGNEDDALRFGRQLADSGVIAAGAYKPGDFVNIYQWLTKYYYMKQDAKNLGIYANFGLQNYPDSLYFTSMLLYGQRQNNDFDNLFKLYERAVKRFPEQKQLHFAYGVDLFNYTYGSGNNQTGASHQSKTSLYAKLEQQVKNYIAVEPDSAKGHLLLGKHYYNRAVAMSKGGSQFKVILPILNQSIMALKEGIERIGDKRLPNYREAVLILVKALEAAQRKEEAKTWSSALEGV